MPPIQILIVDDNENDRTLAVRELRKQSADYVFIEAGTEPELDESLRQGGFDLAITDYHLPWTDGLAIFRRIRESLPDCPVIMYTGTGNEMVAVDALKAGMDDYVLKSIERLPHLAMSVRLALDRNEHRRSAATAQKRFRTLFDTIPMGIITMGRGGWILNANPFAAAMFGYPSPDEMVAARRIKVFSSPEVEERFHRLLRESSSLSGFETTLCRMNGEVFWGRMTVHPIHEAETDTTYFEAIIEDIQNRKLADLDRERQAEELRQSERRYRTLAEAANDMIFILNRDLVVEYVNSTACRMLGKDLEAVVGQPMPGLFPQEVATRQTQSMQHVFATGESVYMERPTRFPSREVWLGSWLVPIRSPEGEIVSVMGVSRDITERVQAERALRESEEQYRNLVQTSPDGILLYDTEMRITFANTRLLEMLGYTNPDEILGKFASDLIHPDEWKRAESNRQVLLQTGSTRNLEHRLVRKNGTPFPAEISYTVLRDEGNHPKAITGIVHDITYRRQQARALQESEARFRAIFESSALGIMLFGSESRILECNQAFAETLGYSRDEILQLRPADFIHPEDIDLDRELHEELLRGKRETFSFEKRFMHKDGHTLWCRMTMSAVRDSNSALLFTVGILEDISRQLESEQAMRQAGESLRRYADRLETLHEIDRAILEAQSSEEIAKATLERIHLLVPCHRSSVVLFDFHAQTATILDARSLATTALPSREVLTLEEYGKSVEVLRQGTIWAFEDLIHGDQLSSVERMLLNEGIRSIISLPLMFQGSLMGALNLASGVPGYFSREQSEIAAEVADLLAVAIAQARLFEQVRRHTSELESLSALNTELRLPLNHGEIATSILNHLSAAFSCDWAALVSPDMPGGGMLVEQATGLLAQKTGSPVAPPTESARRVLEDGQPFRFKELSELGGNAFCDLDQANRAAVHLPLITRGRGIGAIWLGRSVLQGKSNGEFSENDLRLMASMADISSNAIHRAALYEQTEQRLHRLSALHAVDMAISASIDLRVTLSVLLDQITSQLGVDAADVLLLNAQTQFLSFASGRGFRANTMQQTLLRLGQGYAGTAALERRVISVPDLQRPQNRFSSLLREESEQFASYFAAPLIAKGQVKGVLELMSRSPVDPDPEWLEFLETMAAQAAIAVDNASLFEDLQRTNIDLVTAYDATIEGWSHALELRDRETQGHTQRVTEITVRLARELGIRETDLVHVRRGALMHDIGKMAVPDSILFKPGSLTDDEKEIMHLHPVSAYQMLYPIAYLRTALDIPYCHHERWDGSGYPRGLKGEQIPLSARAFAIVDVWDALRSDRPYRNAWPDEKVRAHLLEQTNHHFDPAVVAAFFRILNEEAD